MTGKGFWYVASPYSHKDKRVMEERARLVQDFCAVCMEAGFHVYSPIAHWHPIAVNHELPTDFITWWEMNAALIRGSCGVVVLKIDGWFESKGVEAEIELASKEGLPIQFWEFKEDGGIKRNTAEQIII